MTRSTTKHHALPGFDSPDVGFEQPFEMLQACHERVRRTLTLLDMLLIYTVDQGHDDKSRTAAERVLRYFDQAAPLHHEDEEQHVFPPLLALGNPALRDAVQQMQEDHRRMLVLWAALRSQLLNLAKAVTQTPRPDPGLLSDAADFRTLYERHIETEEFVLYPAAAAILDDRNMNHMSQQMQARRRAPSAGCEDPDQSRTTSTGM